MTKNFTTGALSVLLGLLYLAGTFQIPVTPGIDEVGPRAFPFLIAAVMIASGAGLLIQDLRSGVRVPFSWGFLAARGVWLRILATMGAGVVYGLILDDLGYLISTFLFMIAVTLLLNPGKTRQNLIVSAAFSVVTFVTFALVLKLSLPRGILGGVLPF
jgi:putative tricarboxylic transport membrane protein